jgi:hypothetical protein
VLVIVAVQLLGGMALASACSEPCADDPPGGGCPPICATCTNCTHAQTAIVQRALAAEPLVVSHETVQQQRRFVSSQHSDDIFHVPLFG